MGELEHQHVGLCSRLLLALKTTLANEGSCSGCRLALSLMEPTIGCRTSNIGKLESCSGLPLALSLFEPTVKCRSSKITKWCYDLGCRWRSASPSNISKWGRVVGRRWEAARARWCSLAFLLSLESPLALSLTEPTVGCRRCKM